MEEVADCEVVPGRGITTENRRRGKREITLISAQAWRDVCRELGAEIPWFSRRANLLIDGLDLGTCIGKSIQIGSVRIFVHGETKPCGIMDKQHDGLRAALVPGCRGGVYGQVCSEGTIKVGDEVHILNSTT
jgi:MOSC domain-containing protein YiiM